jgi:hypothetical protein
LRYFGEIFFFEEQRLRFDPGEFFAGAGGWRDAVSKGHPGLGRRLAPRKGLEWREYFSD